MVVRVFIFLSVFISLGSEAYAQEAGKHEKSPLSFETFLTPKISYRDASLQLSGRIHLDTVAFDEDTLTLNDTSTIRRARLGTTGNITKRLSYKAELEFTGDETEETDLFLSYAVFENTYLKLGNFKTAFSLEEMASSNHNLFIERAAATDAFELGRGYGVELDQYGEGWLLQLAVFDEEFGISQDDNEQLVLNARISGTPICTQNSFLHLGVSYSFIDPEISGDTFEFEATDDNLLRVPSSLAVAVADVDSSQIFGLEAAYVTGPISFESEYYVTNINTDNGIDTTFDGGYIQAAYSLTGESRAYAHKKGAFVGLKPFEDFNPTKEQWGAVEVAARFDHLDFNDAGLNDGQQNTFTLGLNWYWSEGVRFLGNVLFVDTDDNISVSNDDPTIFLFRAQVAF